MGVVDQQSPYAREELERAVQGDRLREDVGERGEGDTPGLRRAGHLHAVGAPDGLRDKTGPAVPGGPRHHDAVPFGRQRPSDQLQFEVPAGERPGQFQGLGVP